MDTVTENTEPTDPPITEPVTTAATTSSGGPPPAVASPPPPTTEDSTASSSTGPAVVETNVPNGEVAGLEVPQTAAFAAAEAIPVEVTAAASTNGVTEQPSQQTTTPSAPNTTNETLVAPAISSDSNVVPNLVAQDSAPTGQSLTETITVLTPPTSNLSDILPPSAVAALTELLSIDGTPIPAIPPPPEGTGIESLPPPPPTNPVTDTSERPGVSIEEDDDSSCSSDSEDEDEVRIVRNEDNSEPSAEELQVIEGGEEKRALDDKQWTSEFFEELPDPEHLVKDSGIIEWSVNPVYGTAEAPNKETRLKSPPQRIGGYDWRVVFYPLGLGSDHVSVYIECSNPKIPVDGSAAPVQAEVSGQDSSSDSDSDAPAPISDEDGASSSKAWSVPAQFGVIMYNPADDRVMVSRANHHGFCATAPDWGWPRFYGPHATIHVRPPNKRRAMLQKDTICFRAFVRVIHDDTSRLWRYGSDWNSLENTGYRGIGSEGIGRSYIVAAMSCWSLIYPLRQLIYSIPTRDPDESLEGPWKPLVAGLQKFFYRQQSQKSPDPVSVMDIIDAFAWYGIDLGHNMDVLEFWELLRFKLEGELNQENRERLKDIFDGQLELRTTASTGNVLDAADLNFTIGKPGSVQFTISDDIESSIKRMLDSHGEAGPMALQNPPKMIQVELNRQIFHEKTRKWKKTVDKVGLSETLDLKRWIKAPNKGSSYWLYALIVHQGDIESGQFYSVLRPDGVSKPWVQFTGEKDSNQVYRVTRRDAVSGHEGSNTAEETAAVAYAAIYIRMDVLHTYLRGCHGPGEPPSWVQKCVKFDDMSESKQVEYLSNKAKAVRREPIKFKLFYAGCFDQRAGLGTFDVFNRELYAKNRAFEVTMPWDTKVEALQDKVFTMFGKRIGVSDKRQLSFWMFESDPDSICRPTHPIIEPSLKLGKLRVHSKQIRFWIERIPLDAFDEVEKDRPLLPRIDPTTELDMDPNAYTWSGRPRKATLPAPTADTTESGTNAAAIPVGESNPAVPSSSSENASEQVVPSESVTGARVPDQPSQQSAPAVPAIASQTPNEGINVEQPSDNTAVEQHGDSTTTEQPDTSATEAPNDAPQDHVDVAVILAQPADTPMVDSSISEQPAPEVPPTETVPEIGQIGSIPEEAMLSAVMAVAAGQGLVEGSDTPTVTIAEVLNSPTIAPPDQVTGTEPTAAITSDTPLPSTEPEASLPKQLEIEKASFLFFLKEFDPKSGQINFLASRLVEKSRSITNVLEETFKKLGSSDYTLWEEESLGSLKPLDMKSTFGTQDVFNGAILVLQKTIPQKELAEIELAGSYSTALEHFAYIRDRTNYSHPTDGHVSLSYFGKESFVGNYKNGRKHGHGRLNYRNGDYYEGGFIANKRHGKGKMTFQTGDIFDGEWKEDLMSGQGKMVYAKTGNTYIGGFRHGKKHGKGVMHYLVAEEEQNLCQICYEGEIDALFYDCGHVCSCMDCGKQLEICPVCRRTIIRVVKMWRS